MSTFSALELRQELEAFAEGTMRNQMQVLAASILKEIREELRQGRAQEFPVPLVNSPRTQATTSQERRKLKPLKTKGMGDEDMREELRQLGPRCSSRTFTAKVHPISDDETSRPRISTEEALLGKKTGVRHAATATVLGASAFAVSDPACSNAESQRPTEEQVHRPVAHQGTLDIGRTPSIIKSPALMTAVESWWFEWAVLALILLNSIFIVLTMDYMARNTLNEPPAFMQVSEYIFFALFVVELGLRIVCQGHSFYRRTLPDDKTNHLFYWNVFDTSIVFLQAVEVAAEVSARGSASQIKFGRNLSFFRILRLLRIVRLVRLAKVSNFFSELRMILYSVTKSLPLFCWSVIAIGLGCFMFALFFTETVLYVRLYERDYQRQNNGQSTINPDTLALLELRFGDVGTSILSLFQAITGGYDWGEVSDALKEVDIVLGFIPFLVFVIFALIAFMNVITGLFLEAATERAKEERERFLLRNARDVFKRADHNSNGTITWPDFEQAVRHSDIHSFFDAIDLDVTEANSLFELLDTSGDGSISAEEFLCGCLRLRGAAKALDLLVLSRDIKDHCAENKDHIMINRESAESRQLKVMEALAPLARVVSCREYRIES
jgi:hypothetical protein